MVESWVTGPRTKRVEFTLFGFGKAYLCNPEPDTMEVVQWICVAAT
jgi:hypothetical protein